jgi:hypothetical protein
MKAGLAANDQADELSDCDDAMPGELFVSLRGSKRCSLAYRRLATALEAIDFAATKLAIPSLGDVVMTIGDKRFGLGALWSMHRAARRRIGAENA